MTEMFFGGRLSRSAAAVLLLTICLAGNGNAQNPGGDLQYYRIQSIYVPPAKRPAVEYTLDQLKFRGASGQLPTFDGEQFQVNFLEPQVQNRDDAQNVVGQFVGALKSPLKLNDQLRLNITSTTAKADQRYVDQQIEAGREATKKRLSGQVGTIGKGTDETLNEESEAMKQQAGGTVTVYRFDEFFNKTLIDNTAITITSRAGNTLVSLHGKFYNSVKTTNTSSLSADAALARAVAQIKSDNKFENVTPDVKHAALVLLPYAEGFKYVWKSEVMADGPYGVWVDAQTGKVLQLLPNFFYSDNAKGLAFNPDPNAGTVEMSFEVDPPSGGKYTLNMAGVLTLTSQGADGVSNIVQVNDDHSGTANFDVSPVNGTVVERTNQTSYNGQFQQVNVFAHLFNERRMYMALGSQDFGQVNVTLDKTGGNAFCCPPNYHIGTATTGTSTACGDVFNSGIDATVVAHEFGHALNGLQYGVGGGSMTGALNEGMADFWACTNFNTDTFGGWWGHNCPTPVQSGFTPRQSEPLDIFPDHNSLAGASLEAHSAGQIISWAMWSSRVGMNDATGWGTLSINLNTIKGMTTAGIGVLLDGSAKSVHDSYQDLLKQIAPLYNKDRLIHKLLAGYARAGIFLTPKDAVIDIDHAYLNRGSATGPTFTVWTGDDYVFNSDNTVNTGTQPFNTQFMVEVANDEAFTLNAVNSGWLGGVTSGAGGSATWVLPAANWNTLKAGDAIFYRLTTKDAGGGNLRQSWNPGNGFLANVPVGKAAINGTGTKDCACSAAGATKSSALGLITIIPVGALFLYRRRMRRA